MRSRGRFHSTKMSLELRDVSKQQDAQTHIYATNLKLTAGVFNVLLGPTLAGKTTLMRLMAGLEKPSGGKIYFKDQDVTGVSVQKRNVAMVYQQFINYPSINVFHNIASPLKLQNISKAQINDRVNQVAELLGLTGMLKRMTQELSGGQQQRVALARALVKQADLILLDEPLANLDYKLREELREELPKLFSGDNTTVVYATTEPTEALLLGGYTATMHAGRITQHGPTHEVYHNPNNLQTAMEFSDPPLNIMHIRKQGNIIKDDQQQWTAIGQFKDLIDGEYSIAFRPHHLLINSDSTDMLEFHGQVELTEINGSETLLHLNINQQCWVSQLHGVHKLNENEQVKLELNPKNCFVFDQNGQPVSVH